MRNYKRKTDRGKTSQELLGLAADAVMKEGKKIKTCAREYAICHMTLHRFIKKLKAGEVPTVGYKSRLVFTLEQEKEIAKYVLKCSTIYFGLLPEEVRKLAYDFAVKFDIPNIPPSWHKNQQAGADWFTGFMRRHPSLSIRSPEATSIGRASAFNRHNVKEFFTKLCDIMLKFELPPSRIWNLDETGVTTVSKPKKIVAQKGVKQVGAIVSAERGTLVTVELAASAAGNSIPPMFVFPRLKYKNLFLQNGPTESIGAGNRSGWMTATEFLLYMDHFIKFTKPTPKEPVLLLLDNHSSHIDIEVVEKARDNSIIMLSFPPHCTHRLQPLDVGVNGPFKSYCAKAQETWLRNNAGKAMSIYEIPGIVKTAWPQAATPVNIINAFKKAGIYPFDPDVFTAEDFAPSSVTDRPFTETPSQYVIQCEEEPQPRPSNISTSVLPGSSYISDTTPNDEQRESPFSENYEQPGPSNIGISDSVTFDPELVKPLPKALPRLQTTTKRRKRKAAILTDTSEVNALAEEAKKKKITHKQVQVNKNKGAGKGKSKSQGEVKRRVLQDSERDADDLEWYCIICCDSYSDSRPKEQWIECSMCKKWAHSKCLRAEKIVRYICPNCASDEEST